MFRSRYWDVKGTQYGRGDQDARATSDLDQILADLSPDQRRRADAAADAMIRAYLARTGKTAEWGHPFKFFVTDFNALRDQAAPAKPAAPAGGAREIPRLRRSEPPERPGDARSSPGQGERRGGGGNAPPGAS